MPEQLAAQPIAAPHPLAGHAATAPRRTSAPSNETLEEELPLLQSAQDALRLGDTDRALVLLDVHAKRFPAGALSEERRAAHALAACRKTNGAAARAEAKAFLLDSPSSPLVESVRKACSLTEP
jgi:outer membrane protein assembly factor BamD (BamD/ComL family)